jgi:hypothetical protein
MTDDASNVKGRWSLRRSRVLGGGVEIVQTIGRGDPSHRWAERDVHGER